MAAAAMLLAACAPGSGGTGTGPSSLTFSGTGTALVFLTATSSSGGAGTLQDVCSTDQANIGLGLQDARIDVHAPCSSFISEGVWSQDANGRVMVTGVLTTPFLGRIEPAALELQFSTAANGSAQVSVTVTDSLGRAVIGPATLAPE